MRLILKYIILLGGLFISWNCLALPLSEASCEDEDIGKIERMDDSSGEERDEAFQSLSPSQVAHRHPSQSVPDRDVSSHHWSSRRVLS